MRNLSTVKLRTLPLYTGLVFVAIVYWFLFNTSEPTCLSPPSWLFSLRPKPIVDSGLVDPSVIVRSTGASLCHSTQSASLSDIAFEVKEGDVRVGQDFELVIQCGPESVGQHDCATMYFVHFRGPVAFTLPPNPILYNHDAAVGRTVITCNLPQGGLYEIWVWPDWPELRVCRPNGPDGVTGSLKGSGTSLVNITGGSTIPDELRPCNYMDYRAPIKGRWASLDSLREDRFEDWFGPSKNGEGALQRYAYLPYQCKRSRRTIAEYIQDTKSVRHVAYIGDSILRTHYCGHLWPALQHDGIITPNASCSYSDDLGAYHFAGRAIDFAMPGDSRKLVRLSQRFVAGDIGGCLDGIQQLLDHEVPVTHILMNIGMWFAAASQELYVALVAQHMENIFAIFGDQPLYTWISTPPVSPPIMCFQEMRRPILKHHGEWAQYALKSFQERHPTARLEFVDTFTIADARPDSTSDGRHWVREGEMPSLEVRPHAGEADWAYMEAVWDLWLQEYIHSRDTTVFA